MTRTYAVTVEQAGGSPDGKPHSAPIFSGKLIESVPPGAPAAALSPAQTERSHKRKRPWGAGVFSSQLGGSWGLKYPRGDFGGCKEPREFREILL